MPWGRPVVSVRFSLDPCSYAFRMQPARTINSAPVIVVASEDEPSLCTVKSAASLSSSSAVQGMNIRNAGPTSPLQAKPGEMLADPEASTLEPLLRR